MPESEPGFKIHKPDYHLSEEAWEIINAFHRLLYRRSRPYYVLGDHDIPEDKIHNPLLTFFWMGRPVLKNPFDLWVYQEILWELRPALIIEVGTAYGATAHYLASLCEMLDHGHVLTVDINDNRSRLSADGGPLLRSHPRLTHYIGDICSPETYAYLAGWVVEAPSTMFIFDDDHQADHVEQELEMYCGLVTPGQMMIVEDTNLNGHPVYPDFGPGPYEAVQRFLPRHPEFRAAKAPEKGMVTQNPGGYLMRLKV